MYGECIESEAPDLSGHILYQGKYLTQDAFWIKLSERFREFGRLNIPAKDIADLVNGASPPPAVPISVEVVEELLASDNPCGLAYRAARVMSQIALKEALFKHALNGSPMAMKEAFGLIAGIQEEKEEGKTIVNNMLVFPNDVVGVPTIDGEVLEIPKDMQ